MIETRMKKKIKRIFGNINVRKFASLLLVVSSIFPFFILYSHRVLTTFEGVTHRPHIIQQQQHREGSSKRYSTPISHSKVNSNNSSSNSISWKDGCIRRQPTSKAEMSHYLVESTLTHHHHHHHHPPPTGIVVMLAMGTDDTTRVQQDNFRRICKVVPTQIEYFLETQGLDMVLLIEESSGWSASSLLSCLRLEPIPDTNRNWQNLDGTILTTMSYQMDPQRMNRQQIQHKATIYIGIIQTEFPQYIQDDPSILQRPITPKSCQAPRRYIQATRWYTREMLHLGILQDYDYFLKLDTDILFVDTIPFHLLEDMKRKQAVMGHTAEYHPRGSKTCAKGIRHAVINFTQTMPRAAAFPSSDADSNWHGSSCSSTPELEWDVDWYYTNFVIFETNFWQSSWILRFANFLSDYPQGFYTYRWTDQIFWHQAMGLFLANYTQHVVDYTNLRCMPNPNCWHSSYDFQTYGPDAWHRCDNGGYFLHPKDYRISSQNQQRQTKPLGRLLWNFTSYHQQPLLFESTYQKKCS
jgi:hypothetical protein